MNTVKRYAVLLGTALLPMTAFAQGAPRTLLGIFAVMTGFLNILITFFMLLATVIFLWGIIKYITAGGDEEKLNEARNMILWGIIFLAVMVAVWGFVNVVLDFFLGRTTSDLIPKGPKQ